MPEPERKNIKDADPKSANMADDGVALDEEVREIKREIGSLRRSTRATNERLDELQRRLEQLTTGHAS